MKTKHKARTARTKPNGSFHYNPALARPRTGQRAAEIQAFGTIVKLPNGLIETVCRESVERLNQILVDTMTLRDLYKKHHWQVAGADRGRQRLAGPGRGVR